MIILESFRNIFAVPDLRKRVLFTFGLLAIYRVGAHIPTPGLDAQALEEFFKASAGGLLGFLDMFSGGALRRLSVFALGITPYITASIILQLLTVVWPYLEKLSKEGEMGRRKITQYTRYGTVVLSVVQGAGIALWLWGSTTPTGKFLVLRDPTSEGGKIPFVLMAILTLTTGTAFVMWLGEQMTERGIGNGISLIIFAGIVVGLPTAIWQSVPADPARADVPLHGAAPDRLHARRRGASSSSSSAPSGASRSSTPSGSSAGASTAGRTPTCRSASTRAASSRSSSPSRSSSSRSTSPRRSRATS